MLNKCFYRGARLAVAGWLALFLAAQAGAAAQPERPNILLLVADDLGYSDLGSYGGEIDTPTLDRLAGEGVLLTNFHAAPTCSPTRSMIMSGTYNHRAGLGAMAEWTADNQRGQPGYEGYLIDGVATLPELLVDAGYQTFMAGKWHLGMAPDQGPERRGFQRSFTMLPGAGNHFSDRGLFPFLPVVPYRQDGVEVKPPSDFYSTEYYTDKVIEFIDAARQVGDAPFFGYVAYTAPHWPLQVPARYSDKYRGRYDSGYERIRAERLQRMIARGVVAESTVAAPSNSCYSSWAELPATERQRQARMMEIYAGMVDALDENIGRIITHLDTIGELDNTVIVFISDNGADARPAGGAEQRSAYMRDNYDNQLANLGAENSFVSYGGAWAEVASTPLRLHKGIPSEGGLRVPAIVSFPGGALRGGIGREFVSVMDLLPTFLELAGAEHPGQHYRGRSVEPVVGRSALAYLQGDASEVHQAPLYGFSVHRRQSLQVGQLKALRIPAPFGDAAWELYDLTEDPGEVNNLAKQRPNEMRAMIANWEEFAETTGIVVSVPGSREPSECANGH